MTELSEQEIKKLNQWSLEVESKKKDVEEKQSERIKLSDGQRVLLHVDIDKSKYIFKKWDAASQKYIETEDIILAQEDMAYKKYLRIRGYDPEMDALERVIDLPNYKQWEKVINFCKEGNKFLKIKALGEGKNRNYDIEPVSE